MVGLAQLITSFATLLIALGGFIASVGNARRLRVQSQKIEAQASVVQKLEVNTNSIKDALVKATAAAAEAQGHAAGLQQGRSEQVKVVSVGQIEEKT